MTFIFEGNPSKNNAFSKQNKGPHLGSRYKTCHSAQSTQVVNLQRCWSASSRTGWVNGSSEDLGHLVQFFCSGTVDGNQKSGQKTSWGIGRLSHDLQVFFNIPGGAGFRVLLLFCWMRKEELVDWFLMGAQNKSENWKNTELSLNIR